MPKRFIAILLVTAALLFLAGSIGLWVFLSRWVPTTGKALLIQEVERRAPVKMSIGAMRCEWLRDVVLNDVFVTSRQSGEAWFAAPVVHIDINWIAFAVRKQAVFTVRSSITAPCQTTINLSGRYDLRTTSLAAAVRTAEIPVASLAPFITRRLPPQLADGTLRLDVRAERSPQHPVTLSGRIDGSRIVWSMPSGRITGDLAIEGTARSPAVSQERWIVAADIRLNRGEAVGLPMIGSIKDLEARGR